MICDPYAESGPAECPFGQAELPGAAGCAPVGAPCPSSAFATDLPTSGPVVFVDASAAPGGDGSRAAPLSGLSSVAWASLAAGTTVALAKGTYAGTLPLRAGVTVAGACAAETIVTGLAGTHASVVSVTTSGAPAVVKNLAIRDPPQRGVLVNAGMSAELDGVLIVRAHLVGAQVQGANAHLSMARSVIAETQPDAGLYGGGVDVSQGGRLDASGLLLTGNRYVGIIALDSDTHVTLADVAIVDTHAQQSDGVGGHGLHAQDGARIEGARVAVSGAERTA